ncbi:MAG: serine/threonine-protein kinase [Gemmataceae bacterium]
MANIAPAPCPAPDTLIQFSRGMLRQVEIERIAEHVCDCATCLDLLDSIATDVSDPLVVELRRCGADVSEDHFLDARADEAPALAPGKLFAGYELQAVLGQGGMGIVYRARHLSLNRNVALKMIRAGTQATSAAVARFRREGEAIARLKHPHVVEVYDLGEQRGQSYLSMELVEGGSLAARLKDGPLPPRAAAQLTRTLAEAVAFAHQQGVLHRDLKPANVLLTADGSPKLTDFGLAKLIDGDEPQTVTDAIMGTPSYMAPEQAGATVQPVGTYTDVYALGAILYETLTGQPPFRGETPAQTRALVQAMEPADPAKARPDIPTALAAICLKCLEKKPALRYSSAQALADDLNDWLEGKKPKGVPHRLVRWWRRSARRRAALLWFTALLMGSVLMGTLLSRTAPPPAVTDRPEVLAALTADLDQGKSVELIAATGCPRWYRFQAGVETTQAALGSADEFCVHTWSTCLLELLPDPRHDHYSIEAEVRHRASAREIGEIGLYFEDQSVGDPPRTHLFLEMSFNDLYSAKDVPLIHPRMKIPAGNRIELRPRLYGRVHERWIWDSRMGSDPTNTFTPAGYNGGVWRKLKLVIAPEKVEAFFDGQAAGVLTQASLKRSLDHGLAAAASRGTPEVPANFPAGVSVRGGLGLYVNRSSVAFRNVKVVPHPTVSSSNGGSP